MAYDKVVDSKKLESDLVVVANAIRSRGNTSDLLEFPNGMVNAINSISNTKIEESKTIEIVKNGKIEVLPSSSGTTLNKVTINTNVPKDSESGEFILDTEKRNIVIPVSKKRNNIIISCLPIDESIFKPYQVATYFSNTEWSVYIHANYAGGNLYASSNGISPSNAVAVFNETNISFTLTPGGTGNGMIPNVTYKWEAW